MSTAWHAATGEFREALDWVEDLPEGDPVRERVRHEDERGNLDSVRDFVLSAWRGAREEARSRASSPKVWLVGESNPYGSDPRYALYPEPPNSAGGRLCRLVFGMRTRDYLRSFERVNLLVHSKWSVPATRAAAEVLRAETAACRVVLLGKRVHDAWCWRMRPGKEWVPFEVVEGGVLALPHPSGLSRAWNEPGAYQRARAALLELAPWLSDVVGMKCSHGEREED